MKYFFLKNYQPVNKINLMKKKPKPRRRSKDPFTELVKAINEKTQLPESSGRGQVKGSDVASMKDYLEQGSKDA